MAQGGNQFVRDRLDPVVGRHRPKVVRNGALFTLFCLFFAWVLYTKPSLPLLSSGGRTLRTHLSSGINMYPHSPVRIHGVDIGEVTSAVRAPAPQSGAIVTMQITDTKGYTLHSDASLQARWRTLLGGNEYIDLNPGSPSAPKLQGNFIPQARTGTQVELDTVLTQGGAFDASGRLALRSIFQEFDHSFHRPAPVGAAVDAVAPAMSEIAQGFPALRGTQPGDLTRIVETTSRAMAALGRDENALAGAVDNGQVALGAVASRSGALASTLQQAPGAMAQTRATMVRLVSTLNAVDPLSQNLLPGVRTLPAAAARTQVALSNAVPLLQDLRPTLRDLQPAVADLGVASRQGTPAFPSLGSLMNRVQNTFIPWLNARDSEAGRRNYTNIGPAVSAADSGISWGGPYGSVGNFDAGSGEDALFTSPCTTYFTNPGVPLTQKVNCELATKIIAGILTGRPPLKVAERDAIVPLKLVKQMLAKLSLPKLLDRLRGTLGGQLLGPVAGGGR